MRARFLGFVVGCLRSVLFDGGSAATTRLLVRTLLGPLFRLLLFFIRGAFQILGGWRVEKHLDGDVERERRVPVHAEEDPLLIGRQGKTGDGGRLLVENSSGLRFQRHDRNAKHQVALLMENKIERGFRVDLPSIKTTGRSSS